MNLISQFCLGYTIALVQDSQAKPGAKDNINKEKNHSHT